MRGKILEIPIVSITWDQGIYPREETHPEVVDRYAEALEAGAQFPPILVVKKGQEHLILDGNHRLQAHRKVGRTTILAQILDIPLEDRKTLIFLAAKANMVHGLPLRNEERRMVIQRLYRLGMTIPEMVREFGIPERTLYRWTEPVREEKRLEREAKIRRARELAEEGYTQEEIASALGVAQQTVSDWLRLPEPARMAESGKAPSLHDELAARGVRFVRPYDHDAVEIPEDVEANRRRLAASTSDSYVSGQFVINAALPLMEALEAFEKTVTTEEALEAAVKSDLVRQHIKDTLEYCYRKLDNIHSAVQARMNRAKIPFELFLD